MGSWTIFRVEDAPTKRRGAILLMEEIWPTPPGMYITYIYPCKDWNINFNHINWCRISEPSTVWLYNELTWDLQGIKTWLMFTNTFFCGGVVKIEAMTWN